MGAQGWAPRGWCAGPQAKESDVSIGWPAPVRRALLVVAVVAALPGCASKYMKHRGDDALQMVDIGITTTKTPYGSFHLCGFGLVSLGVGRVDGQFHGLGGDQFGTTEHFHRDLGVILWSYDEVGWGKKMDPEKPETLQRLHIGPIGYLLYPERRPPYAFACLHYLHLGYVGLVGNIRYVEILDFLLGWASVDICNDDGKPPLAGDWHWRTDNPRKKPIPQPKLPF